MDLIERQPSIEGFWKTDAGFAALFAGNPHPMWVYDSETLAFLDVNDAALDLYEYSRDEFLSMRITDIRPPEDVEAVKVLVKEPSAPLRHSGEWRHLTKDGRVLNVLITTHLIDYAGRSAGFVLVSDITERRRAERRLEESEERYRSLFSQNDDAIAMLDLEGRFVSVNPAAERLTGLSAQELLGTPFLRLFAPDAWEGARDRFRKAMLEPQEIETTLIRADGTPVDALVSGVPVVVAGEVAGIYAVARDITERKRAEQTNQGLMEQVRRERERLDDLLGNVPGVVWELRIDPDSGRQTAGYISRHVEEMLGYPIACWLQDPAFGFSVIHPDDRERAQARFAEQAEREEPGFQHFRCLAKDGRTVWVESHFACVYDETGRLIGMRGVNMDVTAHKHAHDALKESEARFRLLAENATDLITRHSPRGTILYVSPAIRTLCGYEPEDLLGRHAFEFIHPDDMKEVRRTLIQVLEGPGVSSVTLRFRRTDGAYIWLETVGHLVTDPVTGEHSEVQCVSRDITQRKEAEEALRLSEERYRLVERATDDVIWDWDLVTGELRHNDSLIEVFGYEPGEVARTGLWWYEQTHPEDRERVVEDLWSVINDGGSFWTGEYRFARGDGSYANVLDRSYVWRSESGVPLRMIGSMTDITERKRTEETLRFLATASDTLSASLDYQTTFTSLARVVIPFLADYCAIDLFEEDGTFRRLAMSHHDPAKEEALRAMQARYFEGTHIPHPPMRALRDGQPQLVSDVQADRLIQDSRSDAMARTFQVLEPRSYMGVPLYARGRTIGCIAFMTSESNRRYTAADLALATELARRASIAIDNARLYREIQRADLAKEEFLAMLSHELRNPLGAISNALQLIHLRGKVDPSMQRTLEVVDRQSRHMAHLVDDLLDLSRITQGKIELRHELIPLSEIVDQAVQIVQPLFQTHEQRFTATLPETPIWLDADAVRIAQVFSNLLNNAAKYTEPGGEISLIATREGDTAVIRVIDTGMGIPPELLPRVFDLFTQADRSLDRAQGGLGIGLTVVKSLVEMHGGTVEAASGGLGQGSTFTVRLPAPEGLAGPAECGAERPDEERDAGTEALRILLVEDNVDAARTLAEILDMWGFAVRMAHDGLTALDVAEKFPADVVLLDIGLPGMDGYEVARRLREADRLPNARLVALTGYGQEQDQRRSFEAGFNHHLVKPVDFSVLERLLREIRSA